MKEKLTEMIANPPSLAHSGAFLSNNSFTRAEKGEIPVPP